MAALAASRPARAGDLFSPEYAGAVSVGGTILVLGVGAITAALLPFVTGTLNPIQMLVNLGVFPGESRTSASLSATAKNGARYQVRPQVVQHGRVLQR